MSGTGNALTGFNANALATAQANAPTPPAATPAQPQGIPDEHVAHLVAGSMRGQTADQLIARRDAAGSELEILARVMNDPNPKPDEMRDYIFAGMKSGQIPGKDAIQILQSMPKDPDMLKTWARSMFGAVMHAGVHAHAAFPRELFPSPQQTPAGADADGEEQPS